MFYDLGAQGYPSVSRISVYFAIRLLYSSSKAAPSMPDAFAVSTHALMKVSPAATSCARSSSGNQQSLVKFAQFYYSAIRPMGAPPVLEELEAELSGLSSNLSLSEAFRQVRQSGNSFGAGQVSKPSRSQHNIPKPLTSRSPGCLCLSGSW